MSIRSAVLFKPDGRGTPLLFARWNARMPRRPIQAPAILVDGEIATAWFHDVASAAFPTRKALPQKCANPDGTGTSEFWDWLT
jgi:hypothetical protein